MKILDGEVLHGDHVIVDADKRGGEDDVQSQRTGGGEDI